LDGPSALEELGDLDDRFFVHAVAEKIGARIKEYAPPDSVVPIIVMSKTPEACLNSAQ
jgi:hypothetical protein